MIQKLNVMYGLYDLNGKFVPAFDSNDTIEKYY